jgi:hypothetical protein
VVTQVHRLLTSTATSHLSVFVVVVAAFIADCFASFAFNTVLFFTTGFGEVHNES